MAGTKKISISMPEGEYKALETTRRKAGRTRSQFIREALEAGGIIGAVRTMSGRNEEPTGINIESGGLQEERDLYGLPLHSEIMDIAELRRRAVAAAGRFHSGVPDLSLEHDKYLTDADADGHAESNRPGRARKKGDKP